MEDIIIRISNIIKLCKRAALCLLIVTLWGELIMTFSGYKTAATLVYDEYGIEAMSYYILIVLVIAFLFFYIQSRLEYLLADIRLKLKEKNE